MLDEAALAKLIEDVYRRLKYSVLRHVRSSMSPNCRIADCLAFCPYPSRGLEIHGFEIKVSREDWLNELKNPQKAEEFWSYCDRWWLVAASEDIIRKQELPPSWGLYVLKKGKLICLVEAPQLSPVDPPKTFLLSVLSNFYSNFCPHHEQYTPSVAPETRAVKPIQVKPKKKSYVPAPSLPSDLEEPFHEVVEDIWIFRNIAQNKWSEPLLHLQPDECRNLREVLKETSSRLGGGDFLVSVTMKGYRARSSRPFNLPGVPVYTPEEKKAQEDVSRYLMEVKRLDPVKGAMIEHKISVHRDLLGSLLVLLGHKNITYNCQPAEPWPIPPYLMEIREKHKRKVMGFLGLNVKPPDGMHVKVDF